MGGPVPGLCNLPGGDLLSYRTRPRITSNSIALNSGESSYGGKGAASWNGRSWIRQNSANCHRLDGIRNLNPLREVVPVDWAEVARALRTVWLRSLSRPGPTMTSAMELNAGLWRSALEAWSEAGRRWLGEDGASAKPDKGFAYGPRFDDSNSDRQ